MQNSLQKGMLVYSWDILEQGVEEVSHTLQSIGCNTMYANCSYHQGRFFQPKGRMIRKVDQSAISFTPNKISYGRLKPKVHENIAKREILQNAREQCKKDGLQFSVWWVGLHNSSLGTINPDLTIKNIWNNHYTYALCPSKMEVSDYAKNLFDDTLRQLQPNRILVESAAFLPVEHGDHHEITLIGLNKAAKWLLSLCFCDDCMQRASLENVDVMEIKILVNQLLTKMIEHESGGLSEGTDMITALLLDYPILYHYQMSRMRVVTELIKDLREIADRHGVAIDLIPSSTPYPVNQTYMEGLSIKQIYPFVKRIVPLTYGPSEQSVTNELNALSMTVKNKDIGVTFSLHHQIVASESGLISRVKAALEQEVSAINYYNLGLLNEHRMRWIKNSNQMIDKWVANLEN